MAISAHTPRPIIRNYKDTCGCSRKTGSQADLRAMAARALFKTPLSHSQRCFFSKDLDISDDRLEWEWQLKSVIIKK